MWKPIALAVAVLTPAAAPQLLHVARDAPQAAVVAPASRKTFAATCRGDQVLDSRPDPKWVRQSFAGDRCAAPPMPPVFDGARASRAAIVAAMARAKAYEAAAAGFQRCVGDYVAGRHGALTPTQLIIENHRVLVSQRARERARAQVNAEVTAFNEYGSDCPDHG